MTLRFKNDCNVKRLQIGMPWRDMIMGEPERLLEWAGEGDFDQVYFSDSSIACCQSGFWSVTKCPTEECEAQDFVGALRRRIT